MSSTDEITARSGGPGWWDDQCPAGIVVERVDEGPGITSFRYDAPTGVELGRVTRCELPGGHDGPHMVKLGQGMAAQWYDAELDDVSLWHAWTQHQLPIFVEPDPAPATGIARPEVTR